MRLTGKIAVVTGAAHGLGKEIAIGYAREGADVAVVDIDAAGAEETVKMIRELGRNAVAFMADVSDEYLVWVYGADSVTKFNGVAVLGNQISPIDVQNKNGLSFTSFNRTLSDALANESILDMQGITEAVSRYYYAHGDSFEGIFVPPEYQKQFERLAQEAIAYYDN